MSVPMDLMALWAHSVLMGSIAFGVARLREVVGLVVTANWDPMVELGRPDMTVEPTWQMPKISLLVSISTPMVATAVMAVPVEWVVLVAKEGMEEKSPTPQFLLHILIAAMAAMAEMGGREGML
ncbi:MAG TPA: hypothetical protein VIJ01_04880, partial [Candidatus Angelobacter sp.]